MFKHTIVFAAVAGLVLALAGAATHGAVITPTGAEASMCYDWASNRDKVLINGIGLNQAGDVATWTHDQSPGGDANQWLNDSDYQDVDDTQIWFYLSGPTNLYKAYLWQYTTDSARGLNGFTIMGSTTAGTGGTFTDLSGAVSMASSSPGASVTQTFNLTGATGIQTVRIDIASSHGDYYVGLAEARFDNTPEPATLALLGLGGIGLILRRKRR